MKLWILESRNVIVVESPPGSITPMGCGGGGGGGGSGVGGGGGGGGGSLPRHFHSGTVDGTKEWM